MTRPSRHLELTLTLSADSYDAICSSLRQIAFDLDDLAGRGYATVSGGPDASYILDVEHNPKVDHDSYFEALKLYLHETPPDSQPSGPD